MKPIFKIFLLLLFSFSILSAQSGKICFQCKQKIEGRYITVDGKDFHPDHFICAFCNKPISGNFNKDENGYYHPNCYAEKNGSVCSFCGKVMLGSFIEVGGKKYHENCYYENVAERCAVCGQPLSGEYFRDVYGNIFHRQHRQELPECDNCGRVICERITKGGFQLNDGRNICGLCYSDEITDSETILQILTEVIAKLKTQGFEVDVSNVAVRASDRIELRNAAAERYSDRMHGFTDTKVKTQYVNGEAVSKDEKHTIYVLSAVKPIYFASTLAHELMHVWLFQNTKDDHSDQLREGSCNFISLKYLESISDPLAKELILQLNNDPDETYGGGFRAVSGKFGGKPLSSLFTYLRSHDSL